jgi:hypothetical protein
MKTLINAHQRVDGRDFLVKQYKSRTCSSPLSSSALLFPSFFIADTAAIADGNQRKQWKEENFKS